MRGIIKAVYTLFLTVLLLIICKLDIMAAPVKMSDGTLFDAQYYMMDNPDVVQVFGNNPNAMFRHYKEYGKNEGRKPCFDLDSMGLQPSIKNFKRIGVVGDSFASGAIRSGDKIKDNYYCSWPQVMGRKYGMRVTNYTKGGMNTSSWLTASEGYSRMIRTPADDLYILILGINDANGLIPPSGESYLGSIKDIKGRGDITQYPNTFYGNYGRIIELIRAHAPGAKMVMLNMTDPGEISHKYNGAIMEIARYYGIPYINQMTDDFFFTETYLNFDLGHPTKAGYSGMADAFVRLIEESMKTNKYYFYPYVK